jgi:hypothetical protein
VHQEGEHGVAGTELRAQQAVSNHIKEAWE